MSVITTDEVLDLIDSGHETITDMAMTYMEYPQSTQFMTLPYAEREMIKREKVRITRRLTKLRKWGYVYSLKNGKIAHYYRT